MDYIEILRDSRDEMLDRLGELIAFESVAAPAVRTPDGEVYPFGKNIQDAYEYMLRLGESMGFETVNIDNYGGHIEFRDEDSEGCFGVTCHLDVMPEGIGWDTPCFELTEKDGTLYGRGVVDDKGPAVAALYAMKAIKDAGMKPRMAVRLILGLDEECGTSGIEYYLDRAGQPDMGFTPDSEFPLINGEMGAMIFDLCRKLKRAGKDGIRLTKLSGGTAPNVVPGECKAVIASGDRKTYDRIRELAEAFSQRTGHELTARKQGSSIAVTALGRSVHGAYPETGLNAVSVMMEFLGEIAFACEELNDFIAFYNEHIGYDVNGRDCGIGLCDEPSGPLKFNVGICEFTEEMASLTVNVRVPVTHENDEVYAGLEKCLEGTGIGIVKKQSEAGIHLDTSHPMVGKLMEAYHEVTGDVQSGPIVSPGGTYAKAINNTLAFGPTFPGEEDSIHQPNERVSLESYLKSAEIYARAIAKVCCTEE